MRAASRDLGLAALFLGLAAPGAGAQGDRPLALVSGDFDEDGAPELISAYGARGSGVLLRQGRKAPSAADLPLSPDLLGTGDFDGDGHLDVVAASLGGDELCWLLGDGRGGFARRERTPLPGTVTALVTGEVDRPDGLADVMVALDGASGPQVQVFEWPTGAMHAKPEVIRLPAPAIALALGPLDDGYEIDLVAAAGAELVIVSGRDRRLSAYVSTQEDVGPPAVVRVPLRGSARALAVGDFVGDWRSEIGVLFEDGSIRLVERTAAEGRRAGKAATSRSASTWRESRSIGVAGATDPDIPAAGLLARARVAGSAKDALVVADPARRQIHVAAVRRGRLDRPTLVSRDVDGAPLVVLAMRVNADALSDIVVLSSGREAPAALLSEPTRSFVINSAGDESDPNLGTATDDGLCDVNLGTPGEQCTLRAALENAIATTRDAQFTFDLGVASTIQITSPLPPLLGVVTMDGTLTGAITRVTLDGSSAGTSTNGLELRGGDSALRNLRVTGFSGHGLLISGTPPPGEGRHIVEGCAFDGNGGHGVFIEGGTPSNTLHGNEIAFNGLDGVHIGTPLFAGFPGGGNAIVDNPLIFQNGGHGVFDGDTPSNTINRNKISRNGGDGVQLTGQDAQGNLVQGNIIGADGTNGGDGVVNDNAPQTTIGGAGAGQGNRVAGDHNGIRLQGGLLDGIRITGNFLDQDQTGAKFDVGILAIRSGKLLTVEGNVFEKLDATGTAIKAHLDSSTNYNFRANRAEIAMKVGSELTFEEGLTLNLDYSSNVHVNNELALRLVESTGEIKLTSSNLQVNGGKGTEFVLKAKGEKKLSGWTVTGGGSLKFVADLTSDVRATVRADGLVIADSNKDAIDASFSGQGELGFALLNTQVQGAKADGFRFEAFAGVGAHAKVDVTNSHVSGVRATGSAGLRFSNHSASIDVLRAEVNTGDFRDFDVNFLFFKVELRHTVTACSATGGGIGILLDGGTLASISDCNISDNSLAGVLVQGGSGATLTGNTLTANGTGVAVVGSGPATALVGNSIFGNSRLGVDLGDDGVTANDPGDADIGPNGLQNYPVVTSAIRDATTTRIQGTLNSVANAPFTLRFYGSGACHASGFGEGEVFLGSTAVTTDGSGNASFDVTFPLTTTHVTATATDDAGNTSEFSACRAARRRRPVP
jgi:parallel beta-helix repeat protein